ncbi:MAG: hypothetical protein NT180_02020 [Actinobacteria bacterium]|nr:hypothetical protein [Actinomycetota bacterium]
MESQARAARVIRLVLTVDAVFSLVFGVLLIVVPGIVGAWLGLPSAAGVAWGQQVTGAALIGLAGLMVLVRRLRDEHAIGAAIVMLVVSILFVILDLTMPGEWGFLRVLLVGANLVFAAAFAALLWMLRRGARTHE